MTTNILIGILGILFITVARMESLKKDAETANMGFSYKKYFEKEWLAIFLSLLSVWIWYFLFPEVSVKYPALEGWMRFSYFCSGAMGAWVLQKVLGRTKATIRNVVDHKTDVADDKIGANDYQKPS